MDSKQKSLMVLTVVALGFLGYQIYELVSRDMSETPVVAVHTPVVTSDTAMTAAVSKPTLPSTTPAAPVTVAHLGETKTQAAYLKMLNQYEIVKMRRQLLDEETAIANAQHQIAMLHHKTVKLNGGAMPNDTPDTTASYRLSYLDEQGQQWTATLEKDHQYQQVSIGTLLPDGYQVLGINHQGVTLEKQHQRELITFNGVVNLPSVVLSNQKALMSEHAPTVARAALRVAPSHAALPKGVIKSQLLALEHREQSVIKTAVHVPSVSDRETLEGPDNDPPVTGPIPFGMTLNSFEIKPVVHQTLSVENFVQTPPADRAQQGLNLPHLDGHVLASAAVEGPDPRFSSHKAFPRSVRHFLALPGQKYTIQLMGSYHAGIVTQFVHQNGLNHKALRLNLGGHNHPWTVALYGIYSTFDEAEVKLSQLPRHLRMNGAWVRKVSDVQRVLKQQV